MRTAKRKYLDGCLEQPVSWLKWVLRDREQPNKYMDPIHFKLIALAIEKLEGRRA